MTPWGRLKVKFKKLHYGVAFFLVKKMMDVWVWLWNFLFFIFFKCMYVFFWIHVEIICRIGSVIAGLVQLKHADPMISLSGSLSRATKASISSGPVHHINRPRRFLTVWLFHHLGICVDVDRIWHDTADLSAAA